jgi:hypothetical protein
MHNALSAFLLEVRGFFDKVGKLAHLDFLLLRAELRARGSQLGVAVGLLAIAAAVVVFGVMFLLWSVVFLLIELGLRPSLAALCMAVLLVAISGALVVFALRKLKGWTLKPERTLAQVTQNLEALKASLNDGTRSNS